MRESAIKLGKEIKRQGIDAFITCNPANTRYLTGLKAVMRNDGHAVVTAGEIFLLTSFLNREQALDECGECEVLVAEDVFDVGAKLKGRHFNKIAVEENYITVAEMKRLAVDFPYAEFVDGSSLLNGIKQIKTADEIEYFRKACEITDDIYDYLLTIIAPGVKETEIKDAIYCKMREYGGEDCSFPPIVVSGKRSSMPHGMPTDKVLADGDFLTVDMGVKYEGCPSDFTRTVVIGRADGEQRHIYDIVRRAQLRALDEIKPGMTGFDADKLARDLIAEAGYGQYFGHSLGHGFGDGIALSGNDEESIILEENMIFTVEPGIYIENYGGVRIEDTVLLTEDGCQPLFRSDKRLLEIL